jgi:cytochrome oxidase Cu insertion factor (SCO1/SenC/PrrC family)
MKKIMPLLLTLSLFLSLSGCITHNESNKISSSLDFTLKDVNGVVFNLSDFLGKVILLNFVTTRCPYCLMEMEELEQVKDELKDEIVIISIDVDKSDTNQRIKEIFSDYIDKWIFALDTYSENVKDKYMVTGVPKNVIISTEGKVSYSNSGLTYKNTLLDEINKAME